MNALLIAGFIYVVVGELMAYWLVWFRDNLYEITGDTMVEDAYTYVENNGGTREEFERTSRIKLYQTMAVAWPIVLGIAIFRVLQERMRK